MKTTGLRLFAALVCVQVVMLVAYYVYVHKYSSYKGNRILMRDLGSKTNSRQDSNFTLPLQVNTSADVMENLTRYPSFKNIRTQCSQLTFSFVSHITKPRFDNKNTNLFLLVLITSGVAKRYATRRNSVRNTWGNEANHQASKAWKRVFLLGRAQSIEIQQEASAFNDILILNMTDNYNNLVVKVLSGMLWSITHVNPRFILKTDDDVYVRIPYLISWLGKYGSDKFYGGHIIPEGARVNRSVTWKNQVLKDCLSEDYYAAYCSGPFYVVSSNILPLIFQSVQKWTAFPAEDAYLGILARENGIKPVSVTGFDLRNLADYGTCNWASAIALGHRFDMLALLFIEKRLQETSKLPRDYYQCLVNDWAVIICLILIPSISSLLAYTFVKLRCFQRFVSLQVT
ncbi:beta-1,3-galactosyltransferase 1-like [Oculina patagonica]